MVKAFERPNHTQTPNAFFDEALKRIESLAELKVVLVIIRQTFGWHKETDAVSLSQIEEATGLSRLSVRKGITRALKDGFVERCRSGEGRGHTYSYKLRLTEPEKGNDVTLLSREKGNDVTLSENVKGQQSNPLEGNKVTPLSRERGNKVTPQKKEEKERKETSANAPFSSLEFTTALGDYEQHRQEIRKPLRPTGRKNLYAQLASMGETNATTALRASIANGWTGVFPPKDSKPTEVRTTNGSRIVADHGDWYVIDNGDGIPCRRYRTPEAFARLTGRNLEEVKAKWN